MSDLELVVARCRESLGWLRRVPAEFRVTVYDKGGDAPAAERLPNLGREAHTYLHHVVHRYDNLAAVTVFSQGHPFDHVPDMLLTLRRLAAGELRVTTFRWLGFIVDRDDRDGALVFQRWAADADPRPLSMPEFWPSLWDDAVPPAFTFFPGAHFIVTAETIRRSPRSFYEKALQVSLRIPDAGHCFERCWDRVFGLDGIPPALRNREMPVYLRPVRRLGLDWAAVENARRANADPPRE